MKITNRSKLAQTIDGITVAPGAVYPHPLDHDGDGRKGGSKPADKSDDVQRLRAEYQELVGKRAYHGWDVVELQRRIDEALAS